MYINKTRIKKVIGYIDKQFKDPYYSGIAAEVAFFIMLSIVPTVMLIGSASGLFSISLQYLIDTLELYAPKELIQVIGPYLTSGASTNFSVLFLMMALWFSSIGFNALMRISNYAYAIPKCNNNFLFKRLKSIKVTLLFMLVVIFTLLVVIYGKIIGKFLTNNSTEIFGTGLVIDTMWYVLRWPISFLFFYVIMIYIYVSLPDKKLTPKKVMPGALLSTLGGLVASLGFSFYATNISRYDVIYGSLSNIIVLMLWLYIISFIIIVGIMLNVSVEKLKEEELINKEIK